MCFIPPHPGPVSVASFNTNQLTGSVPPGWAQFPPSSTAWSSTCLAGVFSRFGGCDVPDRPALVDFYVSTNGRAWNHHDGWLTATDPCSWFGISCATNASGVSKVR